MKLAHNVKITVFCNPEEDKDVIKAGLFSLVPFNLEEEKIELNETNAKSFNERIIKIFEIGFGKEKHTTLFLKYLNDRLNEQQKELLIRQIKSRLDDHLHFFIRLDKENLLNKKYVITDSGNCFHIKISIAAFPAKKDKGVLVVKEIFSK